MSDVLAEESLQRDTLQELLDTSDSEKLARYAAGLHPADIAAFLDALDDTDRKIRLFSVLDAPLASEVAREAGGITRDVLLENLSDARLSAIVEHLDTDDATDLLGELDSERQRELLRRTSPDTRRDIVQLLAYDDDTAGGIMKTEVAQVVTGTTAREITDYLRHEGELFHDIHGVFVTDAGRHLVGVVPLRRLILSDDSTPAELMMDTDIIPVRVDVDQEEVARLFEKYDL
ncbi:MAG: magnesium transporter MgtE N-terminal domain-containing protein, partial [Candidatus Binatia bacterium]